MKKETEQNYSIICIKTKNNQNSTQKYWNKAKSTILILIVELKLP